MNTADLFHNGIVVEDFEGTLERLSSVIGYEWGDEIRAPTEVTNAAGETLEIESRFVYSLNEPRLEIIRAIPGTVWEPAPLGLHHLGYWSDDVAADSSALTAAGFEFELRGGPEDAPMFAYHRHPTSPRIEILSRLIQPVFEQYWADGKSPFA